MGKVRKTTFGIPYFLADCLTHQLQLSVPALNVDHALNSVDHVLVHHAVCRQDAGPVAQPYLRSLAHAAVLSPSVLPLDSCLSASVRGLD
jgi:hypothetical protein